MDRYDWRERQADARAALVVKWMVQLWAIREDGADPLDLDQFTAELALLPVKPIWLDPEAMKKAEEADQAKQAQVAADLMRALVDGS